VPGVLYIVGAFLFSFVLESLIINHSLYYWPLAFSPPFSWPWPSIDKFDFAVPHPSLDQWLPSSTMLDLQLEKDL
jgi:hypothetical protein